MDYLYSLELSILINITYNHLADIEEEEEDRKLARLQLDIS